MICLKCGTEANEGDKVCENCKTPLQVVEYEFDMPVAELFSMNKRNITKLDKSEDGKSYNNVDRQNNTKKKGVKKSAIVAIFAGIIFICPVLLVILKINDDKRPGVNSNHIQETDYNGEHIQETIYGGNISQSEDINHNVDIDYTENPVGGAFTFDAEIFEFTFSNYDGYGTPYVTADIYKVYDALMPVLGFTELNIDTRAVMSEIYKNINVSFSEKSNLTNYQVITAYVSVDETCLKKYGLDFRTAEYEIVVTGLKEIEEVDIFEKLYIDTVEKDGANSVVWEYYGDNDIVIEQSLECIYSKDSFNYGDKFVISVNPDKLENLKQTYGINPVVLEKEYVLLENKYEYLADIENISDKLMENLEKNDIKMLKENASNHGINFSICKSAGSFVYSFDGSENYGLKNCLVFIYKVDYPFPDTNIKSMYVWVLHFDVVQNSYGLQKCLKDNTDMAYPTIYYNVEKGEYEGVSIEDTLENVISTYNMKEERISYDSELKHYFE